MTDTLYTVASATRGTELADPPAALRARLLVYRADHDAGDGTTDAGTQPAMQIIELPEGVAVTFGRSRACAVYIDSDRVSRNHARLIRHGQDIVIEDLGSRNGTRVNGARISAPTRLGSGDEIAIGPVTAWVSMTTRAARTTRISATWHLDERLAAEVDRGQRYQRRFALLMLRLEGDEKAVEQAVARMAESLRPMDTLAEYGPDELAVLLPELDLAAGMEMARQLVATAHRDVRGAAPPITVRAGIASFPLHGSHAGAVLSQARDALRTARSQRTQDVVAPPAQSQAGTDEAIVADPQMKRLYAMVRKVADTPMTVLITGETGAGKEVLAEAIHTASRRKDGPFMRVNCACLTDTLLESELFGHEKGAFTGADRRKEGYFEAASGGTLFLDEIGETTPALQAKLLRVLEQRRIMRIGGTREIEVDTRVVCATNRDLPAEVERRTFREDLYFRISAFTLLLPPLRDRVAEIPLLAEHFVRRSARELGLAAPSIAPAAVEVLIAYDWPGNVRELRNAMERAVVLQTDGVIGPEHLPERVWLNRGRGHGEADGGTTEPLAAGLGAGDGGELLVSDVREHVADVERAQVLAALEAAGGNQTVAARKLGLSRRALIYRLEKYGLKPMPQSRR